MKNLDYLQEYHSTSNRISGIFDDFLEREIEQREDKDDLLLLYRKFLENKHGKAHIRPMLVYIAAKLFNVPLDPAFKNILPVMAIPELSIW